MNTPNVVRGRFDGTQSFPHPWNWRNALRDLRVGDEYGFQLRVDGVLTAVSFGRGGLSGKVQRVTDGYDVTLEARAGGGVFAQPPSYPSLSGNALGQGEVRLKAHFDDLPNTQEVLAAFIKNAPNQLRQATRDGVLAPAVQTDAIPMSAIRSIEFGVGGELDGRLRTALSNALQGLPPIPNLPTLPSSARAYGDVAASASLSLVVPQGEGEGSPELVVRVGGNAELDATLRKRKFVRIQRSEADFNGSVVYEKRFPVDRASAQQLLNQPAHALSGLLTPATLSNLSSETVRVRVDQLSNEKGVRTEMLFTAGADGFDSTKVQALLHPKSIAQAFDLLPQLGSNVHLEGRIVPQEIHDFEARPNLGVLRADGEAHLRQAGRESLWSYEGPLEKAKAPIEKAKDILGTELRRELRDFVTFGNSDRSLR